MTKDERIRLDSMTIENNYWYAVNNAKVFLEKFTGCVGHEHPFHLPQFNLHSQGRMLECTFKIINHPEEGIKIQARKITNQGYWQNVKSPKEALEFFGFDADYKPIGYWD